MVARAARDPSSRKVLRDFFVSLVGMFLVCKMQETLSSSILAEPWNCPLKMEEERAFPHLQKRIHLLERNFSISGFCPRISLTPLTPATCYK